MATWLTNALGHTNLRPAGINIQLSKTSGWGNTTPTASVTYRDAAFDAVSGQVIDIFSWQNSTAVGNDAYVNTAGQCVTNTNVVIRGNSLTRCYVDTGDPSTNSSGNIDLGALAIANVYTTSFWAWTAAAGTTYDTDTDYGTDVSTVDATSTALAGLFTVTCDVSNYASDVGDAAPFLDAKQVAHGSTVTVTMQMASGTLNNGAYAAVAQPDNSITVTHTISNPNAATLASVSATTVTTDASGTATYSFTQADPNVDGTSINDSNDDVSHHIVFTDVATENATTGIQAATNISAVADDACDYRQSVMSFDFQDVVSTTASATTDSVSQNVTSYAAGSAVAPVSRTATATVRDTYGVAVANSVSTAVFAGGARQALIAQAVGGNAIDAGVSLDLRYPVGTAVCLHTHGSATIVGLSTDTTYYVQSLAAGTGGTAPGDQREMTLSATSGGAVLTVTGDTAVTDFIARAHPVMGCATRSFGPAGTASVAWNDTTATAGLDAMFVYTSVGESAAGEAGTTSIRWVAPSATAIAGTHTTANWTETNVGGAAIALGADDDGEIIGTPMEHDTSGNTVVTKLSYGDGGTETQATAVLSAGNLFEFNLGLAAFIALYPVNSPICFGDITSMVGVVAGTVYYIVSAANGSSDAGDTDIAVSASLTAGHVADATLVVSGTPDVAAKIQPAVRTATGAYQCGNDTYTSYSYDDNDQYYLVSTGGSSTTPTSMAGFEGTYAAVATGLYGLQGSRAENSSGVGSPGVTWTIGDLDAVVYQALAGNISIFKAGA